MMAACGMMALPFHAQSLVGGNRLPTESAFAEERLEARHAQGGQRNHCLTSFLSRNVFYSPILVLELTWERGLHRALSMHRPPAPPGGVSRQKRTSSARESRSVPPQSLSSAKGRQRCSHVAQTFAFWVCGIFRPFLKTRKKDLSGL
jgi:hypothetical protein